MDPSMDDVVILVDDVKLRKLVERIFKLEERAIYTIKFGSEPERSKYLTNCNEAHDNAIAMLDEGNKLKNKYVDKTRADIAEEVHKYIKFCINFSMQCVRNCCLRVSCINKLKTHFTSLANQLDTLDTTNLTNVRRIAKDVNLYKENMFKYTKKCQSGSSRALSKAYSIMIKEKGVKFPGLVNEHKNKLGFTGEFERLTDAEKLEVYNSIIKESGRAEFPKLELASGAVGVAVLLVSAGLMVWDIYTAEYKLEAVLRNTMSALAEVGAFAVQVAVEAAVTEALLDMELGVFVVAVAGFVAGTVAGILFVLASGALLDAIFGSGGKPPANLDGLKFHSAKMPDGMAIALEIDHD